MSDNHNHPSFYELSMYLDGGLSEERRANIDKHVSLCSQCSDLLSEMRGYNGMITAYFQEQEHEVRELTPTAFVCRNADIKLRYLAGVLPNWRRKRYEKHLPKCEFCRYILKKLSESEHVVEVELTPEQEERGRQFVSQLLSGAMPSQRGQEEETFPIYQKFRTLVLDASGQTILPVMLLISVFGLVATWLSHKLMSHYKYSSTKMLIFYAIFTPFIGFIFMHRSILRETSRFLVGQQRTEKRMNAIIIMFYISLIVVLNAPLLESIYTGMDMYGFFRRGLQDKSPKMALASGIMSSMLVNIGLATFSVVLMHFIHKILIGKYGSEENIPYFSSAFLMVSIPLAIVYVSVAIFGRRTLDVFMIGPFLALLIIFVACIGYSHPKNKLDLYQSKRLMDRCIRFIIMGFIAAVVIILLHLANVIELDIPDIWSSHISAVKIDWAGEMLGYPKSDYESRWRNGFTLMTGIITIYLFIGMGIFTTITVMRYQYNYAAGKIKH
ncbi:zf-HC2 domain-containing protein [Candidatus Poribacteria bacterium]